MIFMVNFFNNPRNQQPLKTNFLLFTYGFEGYIQVYSGS
jgi:hypothetical protein